MIVPSAADEPPGIDRHDTSDTMRECPNIRGLSPRNVPELSLRRKNAIAA